MVADERQLEERIAFIHEQTHSDALVEEYIEGRELYVGRDRQRSAEGAAGVGNDLRTLPENLPAIATRKVKWDRGYQQKYGITTAAAENLPEGTMGRLEQLSKRIFGALHLTGLRAHGLSLARGDGAL